MSAHWLITVRCDRCGELATHAADADRTAYARTLAAVREKAARLGWRSRTDGLPHRDWCPACAKERP